MHAYSLIENVLWYDSECSMYHEYSVFILHEPSHPIIHLSKSAHFPFLFLSFSLPFILLILLVAHGFPTPSSSIVPQREPRILRTRSDSITSDSYTSVQAGGSRGNVSADAARI